VEIDPWSVVIDGGRGTIVQHTIHHNRPSGSPRQIHRRQIIGGGNSATINSSNMKSGFGFSRGLWCIGGSGSGGGGSGGIGGGDDNEYEYQLQHSHHHSISR